MIGNGIGGGIGMNLMFSNETADIACNKCNHILTVQKDDVDFYELDTEEREMGPETFYEGYYGATCPSCKNSIIYTIDASEYPPDSGIDEYDSNVEGGKLIRGFYEQTFEASDEIYSLDQQSGLFLPDKKEAISFLRSSISQLAFKINEKPELLYKIKPREFEELIAELFFNDGFEVQLTKQTRDGGRDIIAFSKRMDVDVKYIIECKRYAKDRHVGVNLVRNLYGVQMQEGANKSVLVTSSKFTPDAIDFANAQNTTMWGMSLKDYEDVYKWLKKK